jgi:hypothetical protein
MDIHPGDELPIPCRTCKRTLLPLKVREGVFSIVCPACKGTTRTEVSRTAGQWIIKTSDTRHDRKP